MIRRRHRSGIQFFAVAALASMAVGSRVQAETEAPVTVVEPGPHSAGDASATLSKFLDRLMHAESGGRDHVANPRSTAVGAFQFIAPTWLALTRRHHAAEIIGLSVPQVLALRTNRPFARRVAEAYTRENATALATASVPTTWSNLRLAFLLGPNGAIRIVKASPTARLPSVMSRAVVTANPWMSRQLPPLARVV